MSTSGESVVADTGISFTEIPDSLMSACIIIAKHEILNAKPESEEIINCYPVFQ